MSLTNEQRQRLESLQNRIPFHSPIRDLVEVLLSEESTSSGDEVSEDRGDTPADYEDDGEIEGRDYNRNQEDEDKPIKQRPHRDGHFTLTLKREIKLFRKLLKGRPVELTDASPETATSREILQCEGIVLIDKEGSTQVKEYDLTDAVFWSKNKKWAMISFVYSDGRS